MGNTFDCNAGPKQWIDAIEMDALRSFVRCGVRFLVIGGRAVQFHGRTRPAEDLDLLVEVSAENWAKLALALEPLGETIPAFRELSAAKRYQCRLRFYPTVEFLTAIDRVPFDLAWSEGVLTTCGGLVLRVLSKAHVILSKLNSTRRVDKEDVEALEGDFSK